MCLVWNLNLGRASHLTSDLGKTNAFAMLMNVTSRLKIRARSLPAKRGQVPGKVKLSWRLEAVQLYHCLVKNKQKNDCAQHNKFGMSFVGQVVLDTEPFFSLGILFFSARPRRFGEKKVTRNKGATGLQKAGFAIGMRSNRIENSIRLVSRQECERQQCERHQCEANSANANSAKGSTVRMPTVRLRQRCECQQCECDSSAKDDSQNCAKLLDLSLFFFLQKLLLLFTSIFDLKMPITTRFSIYQEM